MAFFGATIETIERILPHPNAERLELAFMVGLAFQLILPKGVYQEGEKVVYFPTDSVIPEPILIKIGLSGKLSGAQKARVKIGKQIRGEYAEGLAQKFDTLWEFISDKPFPETVDASVWNKVIPAGGEDTNGVPIDTTVLTKVLGVRKYEVPEEVAQGRAAGALPDHLTKYDIESTDRETADLETLMDTTVVVLEKVEGQNFAASVVLTDGEPRFFVCSRALTKAAPTDIQLESGSVCTFWKNALKYDLRSKLIATALKIGAREVTFYAEQCGPGIQDNIYKMGSHCLKFFDVKVDGRWLGFPEFQTVMADCGLTADCVPIIAEHQTLREILAGRTCDQLATGTSALAPVLREGVVIKPIVENWRPRGGRLILKKRSLKYLAETGL